MSAQPVSSTNPPSRRAKSETVSAVKGSNGSNGSETEGSTHFHRAVSFAAENMVNRLALDTESQKQGATAGLKKTRSLRFQAQPGDQQASKQQQRQTTHGGEEETKATAPPLPAPQPGSGKGEKDSGSRQKKMHLAASAGLLLMASCPGSGVTLLLPGDSEAQDQRSAPGTGAAARVRGPGGRPGSVLPRVAARSAAALRRRYLARLGLAPPRPRGGEWQRKEGGAESREMEGAGRELEGVSAGEEEELEGEEGGRVGASLGEEGWTTEGAEAHLQELITHMEGEFADVGSVDFRSSMALEEEPPEEPARDIVDEDKYQLIRRLSTAEFFEEPLVESELSVIELLGEQHIKSRVVQDFVRALEEEGPDEAFQRDVKSFVLATGGGEGQWFEEGGCFGLGIGTVEAEGGGGPAEGGGAERSTGAGLDEGGEEGEDIVGVPEGFGAGRELMRPPTANRETPWEEFVQGGIEGCSIGFGRLGWDAMREPAHYVRLPVRGGGGEVTETGMPHLMRYFAERVWGLERPELLISVTGSSVEFDMKREHQRTLLHALVRQAVESNAWIVTSGIDNGISRYVGEASKQVNDANVPVIGVVPWGIVEGRQALWEYEGDAKLSRHQIKTAVDDFGSYEQQFLYMKPTGVQSSKLDRNHTHFFLVDDGTDGRHGCEINLRSDFEACLCSGNEAIQSCVDQVLVDTSHGWQQQRIPKRQAGNIPIPSVCLAVQGKTRTLATVYHSVMAGTPVLLAQGSGQCADFLADAVEYYESVLLANNHPRKGDEDDMRRSSSTGSSASFRSEMSAGIARALDEDKCRVLDRLFTYDPEDWQLQLAVMKMYDVHFQVEFVRVVGMVQAVAKSQLCQVYCMHHGSEDLGTAMLRCVIRKEKLMGKKWKDMLDLIVQWNHIEIMKIALKHMDLVNVACRTAVKLAFHKAFVENKQVMAQVLLDSVDCTETYDLLKKVDSAPFNWKSLIRSHGKSRGLLKNKVSPVLVAWCDMVSKLLDKYDKTHTVSPALKFWSELYDTARKNEAASRLFSRDASSWMKGMFGTSSLSLSTREVPVNSMERVHKFEHTYKRLLGEDWWYQTSVISTEMDLFLWSLLLQRREMSIMLWSRMDVPVRSALLGATFYRNLSQQSNTKPHVQLSLLERAAEFEQIAVAVHTVAMRADAELALEAMERPSRLWKGQTGVDLAILGGCEAFVERCCAEALDCRWSGDLHPYLQPLGLYLSIFISLLSFGLLAPRILVFREPPRAEALRSPSQRMRIPQGYHDAKTEGVGMHAGCNRIFTRLQKLSSEGAPGDALDTDQQSFGASEVRAISFLEKYFLFFSAPVTIFLIDAILHVIQAYVFTTFLRTNSPRSPLSGAEVFLAWCYGSNTVSVMAHVVVDGFESVFGTWTMFRLLACLFFWLGFLPQLPQVRASPLLCERLPERASTDVFYGISLFFTWCRMLHLLSVSKAIGPLVIVIRKIGEQASVVGAIWAVLILAFSSAYQGMGLDRAGEAGKEAATHGMQDWTWWWILRTYFQSFGEPFFEELTTDSANMLTIVMWPVMNLMLVNLLIAIMNDAYTEVKDRSRLQWMVEMFNIAKEYRSPSSLNAVFLLYDVVVFCRNRKEIHRRLAKLIEGRNHSGWLAWVEELRFKFRKFQARDIPSVEAHDLEKELHEDLAALEEADQRHRRRSLGPALATLSHRPARSPGTVSAAAVKRQSSLGQKKRRAEAPIGNRTCRRISMVDLALGTDPQQLSPEPVGSPSAAGGASAEVEGWESLGSGVSRAVAEQCQLADGVSFQLHRVPLLGRLVAPCGRGWRGLMRLVDAVHDRCRGWLGLQDAPTNLAGRFDRRWLEGGLLSDLKLIRRWKWKINWKLLKLRAQLKRDAEAFRSSTKFLLAAKTEYLRAANTELGQAEQADGQPTLEMLLGGGSNTQHHLTSVRGRVDNGDASLTSRSAHNALIDI